MSTEIAETTATTMAVPEALAAAFGGLEPNITVGEQTPRISIKGKVWTVTVKGNAKSLMTKDEDGEPTPLARLKTIILNQVPNRSRAYFEGEYVEGVNTQPSCWSIEGETPDSSVTTPQHKNCASCPQNEKGSKINPQGDAVVACGSSKRICVIPADKPDFTALLLKLPVTSLWEKHPSQEAQGWFSYDAYLKHLKDNNVEYTAMVETWMKFDASNDVSYPKVLFKHGGFISNEMALKIIPRIKSEEVLNLLGIGEQSEGTQRNSPAQSSKPVAEADEVNSPDTSQEDVEAKKAEDEAKQAATLKAEKAAKAKATREAKKAKEAKEAEEAKKQASEDDISVAPSSVEVEDEDSLEDALTNWGD